MAFGFIASADYDDNPSSSAVVPVPTGTVADDVMFCFLKAGAASNSVPSGWTLRATLTHSFGETFELYSKLAGGSEPSDYTWGYASAGRLGATMVSYRDEFDTADLIDVVSNTEYTTNDTIWRAATMTTSAANSAIIWFGGAHKSGTTILSTPPTAPTTMNEDLEAYGSLSRFMRAVSSVLWTGSGVTGNMDATLASAHNHKMGFAVALNPAGAPPSVGPNLLTLLGVG